MTPQLLWIIIIGIHALIIVMAIQTYRLTAENYDRLPDRIPIHFGLSGKADAWANKNRFFANIPLGVIIFTEGIIILCSLPISKSEPEEFLQVSFFMALISGTTVWMMYKMAQGMIDYALKKTDTIWPYLKLPLLALLLSTVAIPVMVFVSMKRPPEVEKVVFCGNVTPAEEPGKLLKDFTGDEKYVYALVSWKNLNGHPNLRFVWTAPDGHVAHDGKHNPRYPKMHTRRKSWYRMDLDYMRDHDVKLPGEWTVDIYANGKKLRTEKFVLKDFKE